MTNDELQNVIDDNQRQADYYAQKLLIINEKIVESVNAYHYSRANELLEYADELLGFFREYKKTSLKHEHELHKREQDNE